MKNDIGKQIEDIDLYFDHILNQAPYLIKCEHNSLFDMEICLLKNTPSYDGKTTVTTVEPSIFFPNDQGGMHGHFENLTELYQFCEGIFKEEILFQVAVDGKECLATFNSTDSSMLYYIEDDFTRQFGYSELRYDSWYGSKSGIITPNNLYEFFKDNH